MENLKLTGAINKENYELAKQTRQYKVDALAQDIIANRYKLNELKLREPLIVPEVEARIKQIEASTDSAKSTAEHNRVLTKGEELKQKDRMNIGIKNTDGTEMVVNVPTEVGLKFHNSLRDFETKITKLELEANKRNNETAKKAVLEAKKKFETSKKAQLDILQTGPNAFNIEQKRVRVDQFNANSQEALVYIDRSGTITPVQLSPVKNFQGKEMPITGEMIYKAAREKNLSVENYLEQVYFPLHLGVKAPWLR